MGSLGLIYEPVQGSVSSWMFLRGCLFLFFYICHCERRERTFGTSRSARHALSPAPLSQKAVTNCLGQGCA